MAEMGFGMKSEIRQISTSEVNAGRKGMLSWGNSKYLRMCLGSRQVVCLA